MGSRGPRPSGTRSKTTKRPAAGNYRSTTRWKVDYDYVDKLGPEEQRWLAQFTDEYLAGDFEYPTPLHNTIELKRERYRAQNHNWNDAVTRAGASVSLYPLSDEDRPKILGTDFRPTAAYQGEQDYQAARFEYRRLVDVPRKQRTELQERRMLLLRDWLQSMALAEPDRLADFIDGLDDAQMTALVDGEDDTCTE